MQIATSKDKIILTKIIIWDVIYNNWKTKHRSTTRLTVVCIYSVYFEESSSNKVGDCGLLSTNFYEPVRVSTYFTKIFYVKVCTLIAVRL